MWRTGADKISSTRKARRNYMEKKMSVFRIPLFMLIIMLSLLSFACGEGGGNDDNNSEDGDTLADGDADSAEVADGDGSEAESAEETDGDADADNANNPYGISWAPCSLEEGADDGLAQCSAAMLPLVYEPLGEKRIEIGAKCWKPEGESAGQLWLLQGGPGGSGMMTFEPFMREIRKHYPEMEICTIDHRGVGYSSPLNCPDQEDPDSEGGAYIYASEWDACIEYLSMHYGDELKAYSTSNAVRDLAAFIDATRESGKKVFVWGGSYGTYLVQRYLSLFPNQADGVVMDSIHACSQPGLAFPKWYNNVGKQLFEYCAEDEFCSSKLGDDPWARLEAVHESLDEGHCSQLQLDRAGLAYILGWLTWYYPLNSIAPAMVYRLERCEYADMLAIVNMYNNLFGGNGDLLGLDGGWWSQVLNANISMSDQYWGEEFEDVDLEEYFAGMKDEILVGNWASQDEYDMYLKWPKYTDPLANTLPDSDIPVLMLQGSIDGATPHEQAVVLGEHLNGEHQNYILFPYSAHGVMSDSYISTDPEEATCGMKIFVEFLKDPTAEPDASCVEETSPPFFEGSPELSQYAIGYDDLWEISEGTKSASAPAGSLKINLPPPEMRRMPY